MVLCCIQTPYTHGTTQIGTSCKRKEKRFWFEEKEPSFGPKKSKTQTFCCQPGFLKMQMFTHAAAGKRLTETSQTKAAWQSNNGNGLDQ